MSGQAWKVVPDWVHKAWKDTHERRAKALCDIGDAVCDTRDAGNPDPTDTTVPEVASPPSRIFKKNESELERDAWEWMANHTKTE
jgi:hypothetical protein